eukprot:gene9719-10415_t
MSEKAKPEVSNEFINKKSDVSRKKDTDDYPKTKLERRADQKTAQTGFLSPKVQIIRKASIINNTLKNYRKVKDMSSSTDTKQCYGDLTSPQSCISSGIAMTTVNDMRRGAPISNSGTIPTSYQGKQSPSSKTANAKTHSKILRNMSQTRNISVMLLGSKHRRRDSRPRPQHVILKSIPAQNPAAVLNIDVNSMKDVLVKDKHISDDQYTKTNINSRKSFMATETTAKEKTEIDKSQLMLSLGTQRPSLGGSYGKKPAQQG